MDEVDLSNDVSPSNTIKLPLANHVDSFVSPESSLSTPEVLEMLTGFDFSIEQIGDLAPLYFEGTLRGDACSSLAVHPTVSILRSL